MDISLITPGGSNVQNRSDASQTKLTESFDQFLTLLTTQLQYQDPTSPMETNEFTNQLVAFSEVEQSIQVNDNLENLLAYNQSSSATTAVNFIGKEVVFEGTTTDFDGTSATWAYNLPKNADTAIATIFDSTGKVVYSEEIDKQSGTYEFVWDGETKSGTTAEPGSYSLVIAAKDADENLIDASVQVSGRVTGIEYDQGIASLIVGNTRYYLRDVITVKEQSTVTNTDTGSSDTSDGGVDQTDNTAEAGGDTSSDDEETTA